MSGGMNDLLRYGTLVFTVEVIEKLIEPPDHDPTTLNTARWIIAVPDVYYEQAFNALIDVTNRGFIGMPNTPETRRRFAGKLRVACLKELENRKST